MKLYFIIAIIPILLSSCLKQSIPDAMLAEENGGGGQGNVTATLSFKINGNAVSISVPDALGQDPNQYTLGCTKAGGYILDGISTNGCDELYRHQLQEWADRWDIFGPAFAPVRPQLEYVWDPRVGGGDGWSVSERSGVLLIWVLRRDLPRQALILAITGNIS